MFPDFNNFTCQGPSYGTWDTCRAPQDVYTRVYEHWLSLKVVSNILVCTGKSCVFI